MRALRSSSRVAVNACAASAEEASAVGTLIASNIHAGVAQQGFDRGGVAFAVGIDHDVDRVLARPAFRQQFVQRFDGGGRQRRQGAAQPQQAVVREHADAAAVAEDRQPPSREAAHGPQRFRGGEQFVQRIDLQQAGAPERRGVHGIVRRQGAHADLVDAQRRCDACRTHDDNGFRACGGACGAHELARIADVVDREQDRAGVAIGGEVVEQVGEIDVLRIAQRDHGGEAELPRRAPFHQRRGVALDCDTSARSPGCGMCAAMLALSLRGAITPRQCGPRMRRPCWRAARSTCTASAPSPASRPAVMITAAPTPARRLRPRARHQLRRRGDHDQVGHPIQLRQFPDRRDAVDHRMARIHQPSRPANPPSRRLRITARRRNAAAGCRRRSPPSGAGTESSRMYSSPANPANGHAGPSYAPRIEQIRRRPAHPGWAGVAGR